MRRYLPCAVICFCAICAAQPVAFKWRGSSLRVPAGFVAETSNYKEGIVTTLSYGDGSRIILQQGGMMRIPFLQEGHVVEQSSETAEKVSRKGQNLPAATFWREDDFKRKPEHGHIATWLDRFPPNIAYDHVPELRRQEFESALNSFRVEQQQPKADRGSHWP